MILTSGTTGTPKGAARKQPDSLEPAAALFSKIPLRARETTVIAAPMFHSWGFAHFTLGAAAGLDARAASPVRPGGDAAGDRPVARERAGGGAGDAPADASSSAPRRSRRYDLGVAARDRAQRLGAARRTRDAGDGRVRRRPLQPLRLDRGRLGDDRDPGRPARRARHRRAPAAAAPSSSCSTSDGREVPPGQAGRIFVAQRDDRSTGYTGGGGKEIVDGLMSTGDIGHLDDDGRLFVDGRDDDMIVCGGENVFPREVEDLLARPPGDRGGRRRRRPRRGVRRSG